MKLTANLNHVITAAGMLLIMLIPGCGKPAAPPAAPELRISQSFKVTPAPHSPVRPSGTIPRFKTAGRESGFHFVRFDDISPQRRIAEVNGGGVAVIDFDRDGQQDLFMTNGCRRPLEPDDQSTPGELFRNGGQMRFHPVSGPSRLKQFGFKHGCAVGDWDRDGFDDLYLTAFGANEFWHNNGDGTFSEIAESMGVTVPEWSSSAAFADLNADGWLDLYVVNYLDESDQNPTLCPNPASPDGYVGCSPAIFDGVVDRLFLSTGDGKTEDLTLTCGLPAFPGKGLGVVIVGLDDDLTPEIFVANDGQENYLFRVSLTGADDSESESAEFGLQEQALSANIALSENGYAQAGMGVAADDYDRNGTVDLFLTHFYGDTNTLYANLGQMMFADRTRSSGLGATSRGSLGFGVCFIDADNNGWSDLVVANGHVDNREWMPGGQPYKMSAQFFRNDTDGAFADISSFCGDYFQNQWLGRGLAVADLDADGLCDFVVSHQVDASVILRNETDTTNKAIDLRLVGTDSNRNGVGTQVVVVNATPVLRRALTGGGSFQSASSQRLHFGLGDLKSADLRITWPSGRVEEMADLPPGRWVAVEGRGIVRDD